jgi:uncharacterized membrane protein
LQPAIGGCLLAELVASPYVQYDVLSTIFGEDLMHSSGSERTFGGLLFGAMLGAVAMYVFDPDKGRRRRAIARDKARSLGGDVVDLVNTAARDVAFRAHGLKAQALRPFRRDGVPDDLVLIERVRAKMGRVVSHPHAIQIGARQGRVTLSGPILGSEVDRLRTAVRSVWGVSEVEDHLAVYPSSDSIPSLQGGGRRPEMRPELLQENWTPSLRVAAILGGTLLASYGTRQRSLAGCALAGAGVALAARGATNLPIGRLAGFAGGRRAIDVEKAIHIEAPPDFVYDMWSDCANFPHFMSHVKEVVDLGEGRTHWVVKGPAGVELQWDAVVTRTVRPGLIAWRTEPGSAVQHAGTVRFDPEDGGTRATVKMTYNAAGGVGHALAKLLGGDPRQQMNDDLARMKMFVERGVPPRDAAQPTIQPQALH